MKNNARKLHTLTLTITLMALLQGCADLWYTKEELALKSQVLTQCKSDIEYRKFLDRKYTQSLKQNGINSGPYLCENPNHESYCYNANDPYVEGFWCETWADSAKIKKRYAPHVADQFITDYRTTNTNTGQASPTKTYISQSLTPVSVPKATSNRLEKANSTANSTASTTKSSYPAAGFEGGKNGYSLYIIEVTYTPTMAKTKFLLSAKSDEDATRRANLGANEYHSRFSTPPPRINILKTCPGINWGAVVFFRNGNRETIQVGASCGFKTAQEAVLDAARQCIVNCSSVTEYLVGGGASGKPDYDGAMFLEGFLQASVIGASKSFFMIEDMLRGTVEPFRSPQAAADSIGKTCKSNSTEGMLPCYATNKSVNCLNSFVNWNEGLACLDKTAGQ